MQTAQELLSMYRQRLGRLLYESGIKLIAGFDDEWILNQISDLINAPRMEKNRIWQAFGPNLSDDSRVGDPNLGFFQGEREVVIDWLDINHPGFRDHLEGRKHPRVHLYDNPPFPITSEMVTELQRAKAKIKIAEERLKKAER